MPEDAMVCGARAALANVAGCVREQGPPFTQAIPTERPTRVRSRFRDFQVSHGKMYPLLHS